MMKSAIPLNSSTTTLAIGFACMCFLLASSGCVNHAEESWEVANRWTEDDEIPSDLLEYTSVQDDVALDRVPVSYSDTYDKFRRITNYDFLLTAMLDSRMDSKTFDFAVEQALLIGGPNRLFVDCALRMKRDVHLASRNRFDALAARFKHKHYLVKAWFVDIADVASHDVARNILRSVLLHMVRGVPWSDAGTMVRNGMHLYRSDGRTILGNGGRLVISNVKWDAKPYADYEFPESHRKLILEGKVRPYMMAENVQDGRIYLYFVEEIYDPELLSFIME